MLCLDGFTYVKKKVSANQLRWQGTVQRSKGCKGGVTTDAIPIGGNPQKFREHTNHFRNEARVEVFKVRSVLREYEQNYPTGNSRPMLIEATTNISEEGAIELGNLETVERDIRRQKLKNLPQELRSLVEIAEHGPFSLTA